MFGSGGVVLLVTLAMPAWPGRNTTVLLGLALLALATAGVLMLTEGRIPPLWYNPFTAAGSVVIGVLVYFGGSPGGASIYSFLFIWVVVYAGYFYPPRWALGQLGFVVLTFGVVRLIEPHTWLGLGSWVILTATVTVAVGVVSYLIRDLRRAARSDGLTGLANRQCWEETLATEMARTRRRPDRHLSVALLDIDGFKAINDRHGHHRGDLLLREMSAAWTSRLRETDLLARFDRAEPDTLLARIGGDEFAVLLAGCDDEHAIGVLGRLQAARPDVTVSVGVARWDGTESAQTLLARADASLYVAKNGGRNRIVAHPGSTEPGSPEPGSPEPGSARNPDEDTAGHR